METNYILKTQETVSVHLSTANVVFIYLTLYEKCTKQIQTDIGLNSSHFCV
jgi:hypothetical protein